ncbi:pyroglutamyl-peptidase I [Microbacterium sp.]|uniref:pyroglutamyl-peptidase I n=1 Tax=Microbacterium sp. TaxID=51671 RepID=UPI003A8352F3
MTGDPTVLLTGFGPFAGDRTNPSGEAVQRVAAEWGDGPARLVTAVLPVAFDAAATEMRQLIAAHRPDVVIAVGLAGGRSAIGIERIAVNLADARIPDNDGAQPIDAPSIPGAPAGAFATLPVKAIAAAVAAAGIPAEVSHTAGTFVCNHVFFTALHAAEDAARVGFVHVPWATGQAPSGQVEIPLDNIARALRIAIEVALTRPTDVSTIGGSIH